MPERLINTPRGPQGAQGPSGNIIDPNNSPINGAAGNRGAINMPQCEYSIYSGKVDNAWIGIQLHDCEINYLNNNILTDDKNNTGNKLVFLYNIVNNIDKYSSTNDNPQSEILLDGNIKDELNSFKVRIQVLMVQLSQNLDYYGYYPNHVPLVSISVYTAFIDRLLIIGDSIEQSYSNFYASNQSEEMQKDALRTLIAALGQKIDSMQSMRDQLLSELNDTREQIQSLLNQQMFMADQVSRSGEAFRDAVSRKASCGFEDVLKAGMAIVSISTGVGSIAGGVAAISLISAKVKDNQIKNNLEGRAKYIVGELKVVRGGMQDIKDGYEGIKELISDNQDNGKLILDKDDFEESVKQFEDLPEAQEYRRIMRQFLNVVEVRNKQIMFSDAIVTRLNEIDSEEKQLRYEILTNQTTLVQISNPIRANTVVFFERAITRIKTEILRVLYMEHKALAYWSLDQNLTMENLSDRSIGQLKSAHALFLATYLNKIEERNSAPQSFEGPREIIFSRNNHPELFELLQNTGKITFSINELEPQYRNLCFLLVKSVKLRIGGLNFDNEGVYYCKLTHHGNPRFANFFGSIVEYRHRRRMLFTYFDNVETSDVELGGLEGVFSYLSPFATWNLSVEKVSNQLAFTEFEEIGLTFTGVAYARYN